MTPTTIYLDRDYKIWWQRRIDGEWLSCHLVDEFSPLVYALHLFTTQSMACDISNKKLIEFSVKIDRQTLLTKSCICLAPFLQD